MHLTGYSDQELTDGYNTLDADTKEIIKGYADGFNQRIAEVTADPTQLPFEFHVIAQMGLASLAPEPWTVEDILAWTALMLRQFDPEAMKQGQLSNAALMQYLTTLFGETQGYLMFNDLRWTNDPSAQTYIPSDADETVLGAAGLRPEPGEKPSTGMQVPDVSQVKNLPAAVEKFRARMERRAAVLQKINALPKMGSYAWVLSGKKTASGRATIYSGPQMGFDTPAICQEGSIASAGLNISGMAIPGLPGIVIGRTPHHAWSMQVGHAHSVDYYIEPPPGIIANYYTGRTETIHVGEMGPVTIMVYRTPHGPVVSPAKFDPATYDPSADGPIVAWRYAHWGKEFGTIGAFLELARAQSVEDFAIGLRKVAASQHFCYADTAGNIAYWMSGMDPVRPEGVDYRMPQVFPNQADWDNDQLIPPSHAKIRIRGIFADGTTNPAARTPIPTTISVILPDRFTGPM
ncbi:MAG: penicillin acylase family protein [Desulfobacterales bacterium]